jgi:hypothetical protein
MMDLKFSDWLKNNDDDLDIIKSFDEKHKKIENQFEKKFPIFINEFYSTVANHFIKKFEIPVSISQIKKKKFLFDCEILKNAMRILLKENSFIFLKYELENIIRNKNFIPFNCFKDWQKAYILKLILNCFKFAL